jgi:hypothetical protein
LTELFVEIAGRHFEAVFAEGSIAIADTRAIVGCTGGVTQQCWLIAFEPRTGFEIARPIVQVHPRVEPEIGRGFHRSDLLIIVV